MKWIIYWSYHKKKVDVIGLDSKNTITDNVKVVHDRLEKLNKNISTTTDNEEIINMFILIKTKIYMTSTLLSEHEKNINLSWN